MWPWSRSKPKATTDHELRLSLVERWIKDHEDIRGELLGIKTDVNLIGASVNSLRSELKSEREERFVTVMDAFALKSEEIITRVLASTRSEFGISRAEMQDLKGRVRILEARGEDGK